MTDNFQSHNAKEEVIELIDGVYELGMSKSLDPVFLVLRDESVSPRGQIINLQKGIYTGLLFKSTLCMGSDESSIPPLPFTRVIRKARKVLVEEGIIPQTDEMKSLVEEIKNYLKE
jgi:hypothetical protein